MTPDNKPNYNVNSQLKINDLLGNYTVMIPGEEATVGRAGTFPIGQDDKYLHRILFQLWWSGYGWTIKNCGSHMPISVETRTQHGRVPVKLAPGTSTNLAQGLSILFFSTPERDYELNIEVSVSGLRKPTRIAPLDADTTRKRHTLLPDQNKLLDVLGGYLEAHPGAGYDVIPNVQQIADELGWTLKKTNQKIYHLVRALEQDGEKVFQPHKAFLAEYALRRYRG